MLSKIAENRVVPSTLKSPIHYPNDCPKAASLIFSRLPENITDICSIFLTGASIELLLCNKNINVRAFTHNAELVTFWACTAWDSLKVAKIAREFRELLKDEPFFSHFQEQRNMSPDPFIRAGMFFALNRCAQNGLVSCGGHEPNLPRFSDKCLHDLATFSMKNFIANHTEDYVNEIDKHADSFLLCCPYEKYSSRTYSMAPAALEERRIDHLEIRNKLINRNNWLLLYEYSDEALDAYSGFDYELYTHAFREVDDTNEADYVLIFANNL